MTALASGLRDMDARSAIATQLDATLFVEAGAGSGKTTALVSRIVQLLCSGACTLDELAAITFTEEAAAQLRNRVRESLAAVAGAASSGEDGRRARDALDRIDEAAISTIHGFARRLLGRYPIDVGLPPRFEVYDEVRQSIAWREVWSSALDHFYEDAGGSFLFATALLLGLSPWHLERLASAVSQAWDRCGTESPDVASVMAGIEGLVDEAAAGFAACLVRAQSYAPHCRDSDDLLLGALEAASRFADQLAGSGSVEDRLRLLASPVSVGKVGNVGKAGAWSCDIEDVRDCLRAASKIRERLVSQVCDLCFPALVAMFDVFAREAARDRRVNGELNFHDLLVLARDLLRDHPDVLASVRHELKFLLVDEFQDTDPLQLEIVELIGSGSARIKPGDPGRLFFVGDPKQSIYRFRGADLASYEGARERLGQDGLVALTSNFRSVPGILDFANDCFAILMAKQFLPLDPVRVPAGGSAPVRLIGGPLDAALKRHDQRVIEAEACAATIDRAVNGERWPVSSSGEAALREPRMSDVAILVPRRTGLAEIEAALDARGIGYRVESASLIYRSQEVRDLLALCRAIDDPADQVALLAVLRSAAFGCGDDDLLAFQRTGGAWTIEDVGSPAATPPATPDVATPDVAAPAAPVTGGGDASIVVFAVETLRAYRGRCHELGAVGVLELAVRDRRLLQLAASSPRARESWRRVRFLLERARAFVDAGGGGLAAFADWVDEQLAEGIRAVESVLPEPDEDVVHILTVHGAKGLEFPVTVLAGFGTTDDWRAAPGPRVIRGDGGRVEVNFRGWLKTSGFDDLKAGEDILDREEAIRVLYVAATRARDHLVICGHHVPAKSSAPIVAAGPQLPGFADHATLGQRLYEAAFAAREHYEELFDVLDGAPDEPVVPFREEIAVAMPGWPGAQRPGVRQPALFDLATVAPPPGTADLAAETTAVAADDDRSASSGQGHRPATASQSTAVARVAAEGAKVVTRDMYLDWVSERERLLARIARRPSVHATEVVALAGLGLGDRDDEELHPAADRRRGRGGTQVGRAVHATLESIDLAAARAISSGDRASGDLLRRLAAAEARAERIPGRADDVARLARGALVSPIVRRAFAATSVRREIYVATTVAGVVLDGFVDLCFQDDVGLTVIDYKTDTLGDRTEIAELAVRYALQAAAYALALGEAAAIPVTRCVLVFLSAAGEALEFEVPDLAAATDRVRLLVGGAP
jgi:ATP-dependent helicase/nuclease subunit A